MDTRNTPTVIPPSNIPEKTAPHVADRVEELVEADREASAKRRIAELTGSVDPGAGKVAEAPGDAPEEQRHDPAPEERDETPDEVEERLIEHGEEWTEVGTTDTPDIEDDEDADDGFERAWREAMRRARFEMPDTTTSPAEFARRLEALKEAEDTIGSASGSFSPVGVGTYVSRPITDIIYVAEWLLDSSTPVHLPHVPGCGERTDG